MKPFRAYALYSPVQKRICSGSVSGIPRLVRRYAVKIGTVHGGAAPGETWKHLYRKGYRVVRVTVTPDA